MQAEADKGSISFLLILYVLTYAFMQLEVVLIGHLMWMHVAAMRKLTPP